MIYSAFPRVRIEERTNLSCVSNPLGMEFTLHGSNTSLSCEGSQNPEAICEPYYALEPALSIPSGALGTPGLHQNMGTYRAQSSPECVLVLWRLLHGTVDAPPFSTP